MLNLVEQLKTEGRASAMISVDQLMREAGVEESAWNAKTRRLIRAKLAEAGIEHEPDLDLVTRHGGWVHLKLSRLTRRERAGRHPFARRSRWLIGLVVGALSAGGSAATLLNLPSHESRVLSGDLNVAVAQFGTTTSRADSHLAATARFLSTSVSDSLNHDLHGLPSIGRNPAPALDLSSPANTGAIYGKTAASRAKQAVAASTRLNADVLVYGTLSARPNGVGVVETTFTTEFYIAPGKLADADELAGSYNLGSPIIAPGLIEDSIAARTVVRSSIVLRARALAEFMVGLSYYSAGDIGQAATRLSRIQQNAGWTGDGPRAILALLLGNVSIKQGQLDRAEIEYGKALNLARALKRNASRAPSRRSVERIGVLAVTRSLFGLAEVQFQRTKHDCSRKGIDASGVKRARSQYQSALKGLSRETPGLSRRPGSAAVVAARLELGIGRTSLCLNEAQTLPDRSGTADQAFREVIRAYSHNKDRLRQEAAEAWGGLGLNNLTGGSAHSLTAAEAAYREAVGLSESAARIGAFEAMRGFVLQRLKRSVDARAAYEHAIASYERARAEPQSRIEKMLDLDELSRLRRTLRRLS